MCIESGHSIRSLSEGCENFSLRAAQIIYERGFRTGKPDPVGLRKMQQV
jgi:hypothetical protein